MEGLGAGERSLVALLAVEEVVSEGDPAPAPLAGASLAAAGLLVVEEQLQGHGQLAVLALLQPAGALVLLLLGLGQQLPAAGAGPRPVRALLVRLQLGLAHHLSAQPASGVVPEAIGLV